MPSIRTPLFFSSEWRKRALPCCCSVLSLSSSDVSDSSWGGPALAPLKGRSATLSVLRLQQAPPPSGRQRTFFQGRCGNECHSPTSIQRFKCSSLQERWAHDRWSLHILLSDCKHLMENCPQIRCLTLLDVILGFMSFSPSATLAVFNERSRHLLNCILVC